ncbi:MAG: hypothetical protein LBT32_01630 [Peptococcaceae bacterium]|nr:hypothetical protein [Peptococcaceae bacterium]
MKAKMLLGVCCVLIVCALTGCQLAQEDAGTSADKDRLAGVFITTEYLDLFNMAGYLQDNLSSLPNGDMVVDGNRQKYEGRLYAALRTRTQTNEETGETIEPAEYVFEDMEGIAYFVATVFATAEHDSYSASVVDEGISDGHIGVNISDDQNSTTLEGTIYTTPSSKNNTYYFNPVYQSADGRVYAVSGRGFMVNNAAYSEGSVFAQTLDDTTTVTENGQAKTETSSVKLSLSVVLAPEKISVCQMDADHGILARTEYAPDALPGAFTAEQDTAYFIVETYKRDDTGKLKTSRVLYGADAETMETFSVRADGICVKHWIPIAWQ